MDYVMLTGMLAIDGFETLLAAACLVVMVEAEGVMALPTPQLAALLQVDPGAMMALEQQVRLRWQHGEMAVCAYHFLQVCVCDVLRMRTCVIRIWCGSLCDGCVEDVVWNTFVVGIRTLVDEIVGGFVHNC